VFVVNWGMHVPCPHCRKRGDWFAEKFGPFCSKRCQLIDFGKWFNEENKFSEALSADHLQDYEILEGGPELDRPDPDR
jgi:endogenous inhibitor of DNA gyrase (YacG/DUF329 family)